MAKEADHIELANRNHDALLYLLEKSEAHPEWVATVAFYKAVHVVEAVFDTDLKEHSNGHDSRLERLKYPKFGPIFKHFRHLYGASLVARYLEDSSARKLEGGTSAAVPYRRFTDYLSAEEVVKRLIKKRLRGVESEAAGFLTESGRQCLKRIADAELR